ncbi:elongation factor P maturation arginine rhamnosyltransferase EarP [Pusillimonas noertemannii]|uniref:Protein-arginine rhamnosyltransferase n=1 Tax=Pusillimonas noertemannii TaxID=305977 RepID=A0A2U1CLP5_9BURK|nr:elongation factor P maturation arginine rhamnosyltransferase EarP [Pusillimonas noertemannii]NYT69457.1 elongation factor P maturation arginine rhamnosyltransferase EarP [Pusillimonas noertemannii]PVY61925.1 putative repeat protein (TIGR03837 family) [Pusillimonas noertemannii]TFL09842.1 elongation factor P maturation arginine rhamnosyltransferase EarP [Pusillimonas noertemannii]
MNTPSFDIFCRVVDNYGDIGVCWRLARQLARHPAAGPVRLWVDDLASFARIEHAVDAAAARQKVAEVELLHWARPALAVEPHAVVIEAFACSPPPGFIARMRDNLWINLEYLSAENWVQDCHALPSLQANGLRKYFFFPGFTEATGGLLREPGLVEARGHWLSQPDLRWRLLRDIGMPQALTDKLQAGWRQVFVFCYGNAPANALAQALSRSSRPTVVIVPQGVLPALASMQNENLRIFEMPFVDQDSFDRLLWSSELNIVRGEDSLVRAIWARQPFLWHIYRQDEDAHLAKLDAWMELARFSPNIRALMRAWNTGDEAAALQGLQDALQADAFLQWRLETGSLHERLASQSSLAERLLAFCTEKSHSG